MTRSPGCSNQANSKTKSTKKNQICLKPIVDNIKGGENRKILLLKPNKRTGKFFRKNKNLKGGDPTLAANIEPKRW
jgi:hypothetical protein